MSTKKRTGHKQPPLPSTTTPLSSASVDDMQEALGITGLVGYDKEIDYTIGTCKAARYSYSQLLNVSRRNSYTYRTKQKHRIMYAAWTGNKEWFRLLFKTGNQNGIMDVTTSHRRNLYHILSSVPEAEIHRDKKIPARLEMVKVLIDHNNDGLNDSDEDGNTPFLLACKYGLFDIVQEYLVHHTDKFNMHQSNTVDANNPFHLAAEGNYVDICSILCNSTNIDMNAMNKHSRTPLEIATDCGYVSIVAKLLEYYPQRCHIRSKETSFAFRRAVDQNHIDVVRLLAAIPVIDINARESVYEATPLIKAVQAGFHDVVKELLKYPDRLRINRCDMFHSTALVFAVKNGDLEMVKCLCQCDTLNIHASTDEGSALYIARRNQRTYPEILQELENFEKRIFTLPSCSRMTTASIIERIYYYDHLLVLDDFTMNHEFAIEREIGDKRNPVHNLLYSQFKSGKITAEELLEDLNIDYSHSKHLLTKSNTI